MKRSTFIKTAAAISLSIAVPAIYHKSHSKGRHNPLYMPKILGAFCNEKEIYEIGVKYRLMVPGESNKEKLSFSLLGAKYNKNNYTLSNSEVDELLNKAITKEYSDYKTITVNGWVITPTEARQCALFSLTKNNI